MKITIDGSPKEIAALVTAMQEQQRILVHSDPVRSESDADVIKRTIQSMSKGPKW